MIYILLIIIIFLLLVIIYSKRDKGARFNKLFSEDLSKIDPKNFVRYNGMVMRREEAERLEKVLSIKNQKGFIQIPLLIAIIIGTLVIGGGTYFGVQKYHKDQVIKTPEVEQKVIVESQSVVDAEVKLEETGQTEKPQSVTQKKVPEIPTAKITKAADKILEKDFHDPLIALYTHKISFLKSKISLMNIGLTGNKMVIQNTNDDIVFFQDNLNKYAGTGYSSTLVNLTTDAINFWKYVVVERTKILNINQDRIATWTKVQQKLEKDLANIPSQTLVTEAEFNLRTDSLNSLVDEDNFSKAYAEQDASINSLLASLNDTTDKYHALMLTVATKEKAQTDQELASLKAQLEVIKNTPLPQAPTVVTSTQLQPTSMDCQTTYDGRSGFPSTKCTEFPSMKSMTCDTTYETGSHNPLKHCYFQ